MTGQPHEPRAEPHAEAGPTPVTWGADQVSAAQSAFDTNKGRILAGETFRSQKPPDWRRGKSPCDYA